MEFSDVQVLFDRSLGRLVDGIRGRIPSHWMQSGTEVHATGDHGTLVNPRALALTVGVL